MAVLKAFRLVIMLKSAYHSDIMFFRKSQGKINPTVTRSISTRQRILSLQFYLLGFLLALTHKKVKDIKDIPEANQKHIEKTVKSYSLSREEFKICQTELLKGIEHYYESLMLHEPSQQRYIDLQLIKSTLTDYKLSFRGENSAKELKTIIMFLFDYSFFHSNTLLVSANLIRSNLSEDMFSEKIQQFLRTTIQSLGLTHILYQQIYETVGNSQNLKANFSDNASFTKLYPQEYIDACLLLLVSDKADISDVRRQYNHFMRDNHPDKLASQNLSEDELRFHNDMTHQYNQAYQTIKKFKNSQ